MSRLIGILRAWLPLAVIVTGLSALAYLAMQQSLRQGANDPQIQLAEDAAAALDHGQAVGSVVPKQQIDMASSLAPFVIVFDSAGKPVASSALLDGAMPDYPQGALQAGKASGENRVTWQPQSGVRIASVAVPYGSGYVVAGRSLREVEKRVDQTQTICLAAWAAILLISLASVAFGEVVLRS